MGLALNLYLKWLVDVCTDALLNLRWLGRGTVKIQTWVESFMHAGEVLQLTVVYDKLINVSIHCS